MATLPLQRRPVITRNPTVFTVSHGTNSILAVTPPTKRTAVISFQTYDSAHHFSRLLESYKMMEKEWPDLSGNSIKLIDDGRKELKFIDVVQWDIEELKHECALRYLNLIVADDDLKGSLRGVYISLDMEAEVLKHHLNFLWEISE